MTALDDLRTAGVSIWLDDLGRRRLDSGELADWVGRGWVAGVTTNPTIFAKAVGDGTHYATDLEPLRAAHGSAEEAVATLTAEDVRRACDLLRPLYDRTSRVDGRVSLEVDPRLAHDTEGTIAAARTLWSTVDRPNLMVKIPATLAGLPAVTAVLADGISVNVTLIFGLERYRAVTDAWLAGVEAAAAHGRDLGGIGSVASFFVSRLDSAVDRWLTEHHPERVEELQGRAAIANTRLAYRHFEEVLASPRWAALQDAGAQVQRPLWASTSTKNPTYDDTMYVVELVADQTVNTVPVTTLEALLDHGKIRGDTVRAGYGDAEQLLDSLAALGLSYDDVVRTLEDEGVASFAASWEELLAAVERALRPAPPPAG